MLLHFPEAFDKNEWAVIIGILINIIIFMCLPKRIPKEITPLIILLSMSYPKILDHSLAVSPLNYYDIMDSTKYEIFDLLLYGVYPAFGYLFVYILDYFKLKGFQLFWYLLAWNLFAVGVEYLLIKLGIFVYKGWSLAYSLPIYTIVLSLTLLFYKLAMYFHNKNTQQHTSNFR
ncbi:hypothetical protein KO561_09390 [Radiobacillus kanasensis]|uniref:hypothetical protein n=1 Tax=Radiobacillus kanasensis TaxID=2844358 RepID=UPI001E5712C5|nr:hypothetical protein [Radiobacillus kanasensis]UFU01126.1 hypothetical protein KO561_09390 [Radiobacillus kanasensis]